jgi:nuclear transport factor 2 (NTF2) superfamily protein
MQESPRPPCPPFTAVTAAQKVRAAEDAWNSRDPQRVAQAYTVDSRWRNRNEFIRGREEIAAFLTRKWAAEQEYRLIKELWATDGGQRIAVRFAYEYVTVNGAWFRAYGNENWAFDGLGYMAERHASINDLAISESQRLFRWPLGRRPDDHPGLSALGL